MHKYIYIIRIDTPICLQKVNTNIYLLQFHASLYLYGYTLTTLLSRMFPYIEVVTTYYWDLVWQVTPKQVIVQLATFQASFFTLRFPYTILIKVVCYKSSPPLCPQWTPTPISSAVKCVTINKNKRTRNQCMVCFVFP